MWYRILAAVYLALIVAILAVGVSLLPGCGHAPVLPLAPQTPSVIPLNVAVPQIAEPVQRSVVEIDKSLELLRAISGPDATKEFALLCQQCPNLKSQVDQAIVHLEAAKNANADTITKVQTANESVKADAQADKAAAETIRKLQQQIDDLNNHDAARAWLQRIGVAALALGAAAMAACFIWMPKLIPAAVAVLAFGGVCVTLARFLPMIEWAILAGMGIGVLYLAWYVWKHHDQIKTWVAEETQQPAPEAK